VARRIVTQREQFVLAPWRSAKLLCQKMASGTASARYILLPHWDPDLAHAIMLQHHQEMQRGRTAHQWPMDDKWRSDVMSAANQGGFTLHDHVGDAPQNGYMVSLDKQSEWARPIGDLKSQDIADFANKHHDKLDQRGHYLGGWLDNGNFYLDISKHRPTLDRAASDAVQNNQIGIYDLAHGNTMYTPDAVQQSGDIGLAYPPKMKNPLTSSHHPHLIQDAYHRYFDDPPYQLEVEDSHDWEQHHPEDPDSYKPHQV
jgi:hypothetical protein